LYGCEIWSLILRKELKVLENRVLAEEDICEGHPVMMKVRQGARKIAVSKAWFFLVFCMILLQDISAHTDINNNAILLNNFSFVLYQPDAGYSVYGPEHVVLIPYKIPKCV
jgi:hypothetical protein